MTVNHTGLEGMSGLSDDVAAMVESRIRSVVGEELSLRLPDAPRPVQGRV